MNREKAEIEDEQQDRAAHFEEHQKSLKSKLEEMEK